MSSSVSLKNHPAIHRAIVIEKEDTDKTICFYWANIINYWYFTFSTEQFIYLLNKQLVYWANMIVTGHLISYW